MNSNLCQSNKELKEIINIYVKTNYLVKVSSPHCQHQLIQGQQQQGTGAHHFVSYTFHILKETKCRKKKNQQAKKSPTLYRSCSPKNLS